MSEQPMMPMPPQPQDPLEGKNYRVRRLLIKMDVDIYDDDGFLEERGITSEVSLVEKVFPAELVALLKTHTQLGRGFIARGTAAEAVAPTDPPIVDLKEVSEVA